MLILIPSVPSFPSIHRLIAVGYNLFEIVIQIDFACVLFCCYVWDVVRMLLTRGSVGGYD